MREKRVKWSKVPIKEKSMPSLSLKQHRFMEGVAHNPEFAKKAGIPQSVGKDFAAADKKTGKFSKSADRISRMYKA